VGWLGVSMLLMALTFCIAAGIYGVLALHTLQYRKTIVVEVATAFVNRLLPSGLGSLGLHGIYLYKQKHTAAEATVVVSVNNATGMAAHLLLLALVMLLRPDTVHELTARHHVSVPWQALVGFIALAIILLLVPRVKRALTGFGTKLVASVRKLKLSHVLKALALAALLTCTYTFILLATTRSIGLELGLVQIFIVFSIGKLFSTATPTPGGLVGAEAGLFAGFVAYGVAAPQAAAAVLLFRLVSYWLPLLPGALALLLARKQHLV
jgi:uncharacterized membrane protein YbhN (UPF0104 family)